MWWGIYVQPRNPSSDNTTGTRSRRKIGNGQQSRIVLSQTTNTRTGTEPTHPTMATNIVLETSMVRRLLPSYPLLSLLLLILLRILFDRPLIIAQGSISVELYTDHAPKVRSVHPHHTIRYYLCGADLGIPRPAATSKPLCSADTTTTVPYAYSSPGKHPLTC